MDLKFKHYFMSGALRFDNENEISEIERKPSNRCNESLDFFHVETKNV